MLRKASPVLMLVFVIWLTPSSLQAAAQQTPLIAKEFDLQINGQCKGGANIGYDDKHRAHEMYCPSAGGGKKTTPVTPPTSVPTPSAPAGGGNPVGWLRAIFQPGDQLAQAAVPSCKRVENYYWVECVGNKDGIEVKGYCVGPNKCHANMYKDKDGKYKNIEGPTKVACAESILKTTCTTGGGEKNNPVKVNQPPGPVPRSDKLKDTNPTTVTSENKPRSNPGNIQLPPESPSSKTSIETPEKPGSVVSRNPETLLNNPVTVSNDEQSGGGARGGGQGVGGGDNGAGPLPAGPAITGPQGGLAPSAVGGSGTGIGGDGSAAPGVGAAGGGVAGSGTGGGSGQGGSGGGPIASVNSAPSASPASTFSSSYSGSGGSGSGGGGSKSSGGGSGSSGRSGSGGGSGPDSGYSSRSSSYSSLSSISSSFNTSATRFASSIVSLVSSLASNLSSAHESQDYGPVFSSPVVAREIAPVRSAAVIPVPGIAQQAPVDTARIATIQSAPYAAYGLDTGASSGGAARFLGGSIAYDSAIEWPELTGDPVLLAADSADTAQERLVSPGDTGQPRAGDALSPQTAGRRRIVLPATDLFPNAPDTGASERVAVSPTAPSGIIRDERVADAGTAARSDSAFSDGGSSGAFGTILEQVRTNLFNGIASAAQNVWQYFFQHSACQVEGGCDDSQGDVLGRAALLIRGDRFGAALMPNGEDLPKADIVAEVTAPLAPVTPTIFDRVGNTLTRLGEGFQAVPAFFGVRGIGGGLVSVPAAAPAVPAGDMPADTQQNTVRDTATLPSGSGTVQARTPAVSEAAPAAESPVSAAPLAGSSSVATDTVPSLVPVQAATSSSYTESAASSSVSQQTTGWLADTVRRPIAWTADLVQRVGGWISGLFR